MTLPSSRAVSFPRYRVEERSPDLAAFIVGFADTPAQYQTLLSRRAAQLSERGQTLSWWSSIKRVKRSSCVAMLG